MRKKPKTKQSQNCLAPADLFALRLSAAEVERARERCARIRAERTAEVREKHLAAVQAQAALEHAARTRETSNKAEEAALAGDLEAHRILAAEIGKRYAVDWKETAFDSETGVLMPLPR